MMSIKIFSRWLYLTALVAIFVAFAITGAPTTGRAASFLGDDVLIGRADGQIDVYRIGQLNRSLSINDGLEYRVRGLCFSTNGKYLYVTSAKYERPIDKWTGRISRFDDNGILINSSFVSDLQPNQIPHSCIVDAAGYLYVEVRGHADQSPSVRKYDSAGRQVRQFSVPTDTGDYGSIDLLADQRTLVYVTGSRIRRFDVINNAPLSDFVNISTLPLSYNGNCGAVRVRQNGEIWANCNSQQFDTVSEVLRLRATGQLIPNDPPHYSVFRASPKFSSDAVSFWVIQWNGVGRPTYVSKIGIDTEGERPVDIGNDVMSAVDYGSFAIYGEYTAATTQCSDGIDNDGDSKTDFPADLYCKSPSQAYESPCWKVVNHLICLGGPIPWVHMYPAYSTLSTQFRQGR